MRIKAFLLVLLFAGNVHALTTISSSDTFPYTLSTAGETYQLSEDISCATTCFKVAASNIVFDLNSHTMTFGTATSPALSDPGFESWTDASTPANWTIVDGTVTRTTAIAYGDYDAQLSNTASIKSVNFTLAANQTYVYYASIKGNSSDSCTVTIKKASDDSTLSSVTITGDYIARGFAMPNGIIDYTEHEYKPAEEQTAYMQIDCSGTASTKLLYYADIKPAKSYGFINNNYLKAGLTPDLAPGGWATISNFTLSGGTIAQSSQAHVKSAAVYMNAGPSGLYKDMTINMTGQNTSAITITGATNLTIDSVTSNTTNLFHFNRMHSPGGIDLPNPGRGSYKIEIMNNTLNDDPEYGLRVYGYGYTDTELQTLSIHNNYFYHKAANTESYGLVISGMINVDIYENVFSPDTSRGGRGILLDATANHSGILDGTENVNVYDNVFENIQEKANTEYGRDSLEAVAIRIRNWGDDDPVEHHKNLKVYGNTISVKTDDSFSHAAYGINITASGATDDIEIYNNTIAATYNGTSLSDWVAGIALQNAGNAGGSYKIRNNDITSNMYGIGMSGNDGTDATNIDIYSNNITATLAPIRMNFLSYSGAISDIDIYCNKLTSSGTSGYPFYLDGAISDVLIDYNLITNSNIGGHEVWVDADESSDVLFYGNGQIDVIGGGQVGAAGAATNGEAGCYLSAGVYLAKTRYRYGSSLVHHEEE